MTVPDRIGPYRIERLLGVGSFATVWLGHDPMLDSSVAIKVLAENWSHDLRVRERFLDEARLLRRLDHQRLIRVHAVGELPDGRPYSVLDWADGGSLRDRLAAGPLPVPTALRLLVEIAAGVAVLHRRGVVHRDLTPGNILFRSAPGEAASDVRSGGWGPEGGQGPAEMVLIADLGLAKALAAASGLTARAGTPGYMAPEQDDPLAVVDTRADVYGLGRLGIRLVGEPGGPAGGSPSVSAVLRTATAHRPADRYPDASAFQKALELACRRPVGHRPTGFTAARAGGGDATSSVPAPRPGRRSTVVFRRRPRRLGLVAATLGWLVAVGATGADTAPGRAADRVTVGGGRLTVVLPAGWRAFGDGWAGQYDAAGGLEPGVLISPYPRRWWADPTVPGAFVGVSATAAARTTPAGFLAERRHADCVPGATRRIRHGGIDWMVAGFACAAGRPVIVEAAGVGPGDAGLVYAQVVPPVDGGPDFVDRLLTGIQVRPAGLSGSPP